MKIGDIVKSPNGQPFKIVKINNDDTVDITPIEKQENHNLLHDFLGDLSSQSTFTLTVSIDQLELMEETTK